MFEIYGGYDKFTQWTKGQKLIMNELPVGAEILFYNDITVDEPLVTEVYEMVDSVVDDKEYIIKVCDVPNALLTEAKTIRVTIPTVVMGLYGIRHKYNGLRTKYITVEAAEMPSDYVYEDTDTEGSSFEYILLTDRSTKEKYKLYVMDGKLMMGEVEIN